MSEKKYSKEHTMSEIRLVFHPFCGIFCAHKTRLISRSFALFCARVRRILPLQGAKCTQKMCKSYAEGEKFASNACQTARKKV